MLEEIWTAVHRGKSVEEIMRIFDLTAGELFRIFQGSSDY